MLINLLRDMFIHVNKIRLDNSFTPQKVDSKWMVDTIMNRIGNVRKHFALPCDMILQVEIKGSNTTRKFHKLEILQIKNLCCLKTSV